jgi:hypothetical protein
MRGAHDDHDLRMARLGGRGRAVRTENGEHGDDEGKN